MPPAGEPADELEALLLSATPDTFSPAGVATPPGTVTAWVTTGSPLAVRSTLEHYSHPHLRYRY